MPATTIRQDQVTTCPGCDDCRDDEPNTPHWLSERVELTLPFRERYARGEWRVEWVGISGATYENAIALDEDGRPMSEGGIPVVTDREVGPRALESLPGGERLAV